MRLPLAVSLLTLVVSASAFASEFATGVVDPYLQIQSTLAADSTDGVGQQAATIASTAGRLGSEAAPIAAAARELQAADTLAASREAFAKLTDAVTRYAKATGTTMGVRLTYCPMEKKHWLQRDETIANPYAGKKMLKCGEFKDKL
jgi:membrane fusion protein, copper/silver efflux system